MHDLSQSRSWARNVQEGSALASGDVESQSSQPAGHAAGDERRTRLACGVLAAEDTHMGVPPAVSG